MSHRKGGGLAAALGMALALAGSAYADAGSSPNGPPGPEGNPNAPAAQPQANGPQANGPQGPAGNDQHGKSQAPAKAKGKGTKPAVKPKPKSKSNHANPKPGTPRKGGREDRPAGKITICHATRSETNPYVEITISVNGLNGHGPEADPHHHAGSWKDIIPAPAGGCPTTVQHQSAGFRATSGTAGARARRSSGRPDSGLLAPAATQAVLGARAERTAPSEDGEAGNAVLGAAAAGARPPAEVLAARRADGGDSLPFTGFELAFLLVLAAAALLGGIALRRATRSTEI